MQVARFWCGPESQRWDFLQVSSFRLLSREESTVSERKQQRDLDIHDVRASRTRSKEIAKRGKKRIGIILSQCRRGIESSRRGALNAPAVDKCASGIGRTIVAVRASTE